MSNYPVRFTNTPQRLSAAQLSEVGQSALADLAAKGYYIQLGLTRSNVTALQTLSLQPSIREYCPNDCTKRFHDEATTADWLGKGRAAILLVQADTGEIAGYGWVGDGTSEHVPGGTETFAIRLSEAHQGKGLATPYNQVIVDVARQLYGSEHMWGEAWQSNAAAVHIYQKIGFVIIGSEPTTRPTAAGGTTQDTRLYMIL